MLFICYAKCSTCQKARAFLEGKGAAFETREIKTDRPTVPELRAWHALS
ncbi:MAG: glutaredoxin domain-containing protein, partial [Oscillospiraceae bacterium]